MPEGDSVLQLSNRLQFMAGREVTGCSVRVPRYATVHLDGMVCERVWPYGKHLFMQFDQTIVHTHLKMEGTWAIHYAGDRWRKPGHTARIVLQLANAPRDIEVVGHQLGFVEIYPADQYHQRIAHLGPDILDPDWDREEALRRLNNRPQRAIGAAHAGGHAYRGGAISPHDAPRDVEDAGGIHLGYWCGRVHPC